MARNGLDALALAGVLALVGMAAPPAVAQSKPAPAAAAKPAPKPANKPETVADIQAELGKLDGQVDQLRNELVKIGPVRGLPTDPATALTRLDQLDAELRRLTDRVDVLSNDIGRIVADASNRVGDIEFRLTELEGGDTSTLGKPAPLGGGLTPMPRPAALGGAAVPPAAETPPTEAAPPPAAGAPASGQLAVAEQSDFDAAKAAAEAGNNAEAAQLFGKFLDTYPGGPLSTEAQYRRGEALAAQADWRGAARSYLDAFSGEPQGPLAPKALYQLAVSLSKFGKTDEACLTLGEVDRRYPGSEVTGDVASQRQALNCQ